MAPSAAAVAAAAEGLGFADLGSPLCSPSFAATATAKRGAAAAVLALLGLDPPVSRKQVSGHKCISI